MWGRGLIGVLATACATLTGAPAAAQQGVIAPMASASSGGFSVWADGAYHSINLPNFALGFFELGVGTFQNLGPVQTYKPRVTGEGVSGGIGFALPGGNTKISLVGSYIDADAIQTGTVRSAFNAAQLLNGVLTFPCGPCTLPSRLETDHRSWWLGLNAASQFAWGQVLVIPSLEILGGVTRTRQSYVQDRLPDVGGAAFYNSSTKVQWRDAGGKAGLAIVMPVVPMVEFGLGGTLAVVYRHVNLHGTDHFDDGIDRLASTIDVSRTTAAFISGAQAQIIVRPLPNVQVRAFGGLEHDSRVPGIVSPNFTADQFLALIGTNIPATPASIGFSSQTSYFVGGGVTVKFAP